MLSNLISVAIGGAVGATTRYAFGVWMVRFVGPAFPWATLMVNVLGSFVMGYLFVVLTQSGNMRWAPGLLGGLLGGFTTFSAFSLDAVALYERGQNGLALAYVCASVVLAIAGLILGMWLARGAAA